MLRTVALAWLVLCACGGKTSPGSDAGPPDAAVVVRGPTPVLTSLAPAVVGAGAAAFALTLAGASFDSDAVVLWDGEPRAATIASASSATLEITADEVAPPGWHDVAVINPGGGISATLALEVTFTNPAPTLSALSPDHATEGGPDLTLGLDGDDFALGAQVRIAGALGAATRLDGQHLQATIPAALLATLGSVAVSVVNPGPGGGESATLQLAVVAPAAPAGVLERLSLTNAGAEITTYVVAPGPIDLHGRYALFQAADGVVDGDTNGRWDLFIRDTCRGQSGCTPSTRPVSVLPDGTFSVDGDSGGAVATPDLRYVAFTGPQGLVSGSPRQPFYVRDTCIGAPAGCVPTTISGQAFAYGNLAISADGRYVAFDTIGNYAAGDPGSNTSVDVYVHVTCIGQTGCTPGDVLVSANPAGNAGHATSGLSGEHPAISADGRYVAFISDATDLVAGDTNAAVDVFLRDTCLGATGCTPSTVMVSVDSAGTQGSGASDSPMIDATGRFVAFRSASALVSGVTGGGIYLRDTCAGAAACTPSTILVSARPDGTGSGVSPTTWGPTAISADGRFVGFLAYGDGVVAGDSDGFADLFVRDTCAGVAACTPVTHWISTGPGGSAPDHASAATGLALSSDGAFAAFLSGATNLVAGDSNGLDDVFLAATGF